MIMEKWGREDLFACLSVENFLKAYCLVKNLEPPPPFWEQLRL